MWRPSGRGWTVRPSAPASMTTRATSSTSTHAEERWFRSKATLFKFTLRFVFTVACPERLSPHIGSIATSAWSRNHQKHNVLVRVVGKPVACSRRYVDTLTRRKRDRSATHLEGSGSGQNVEELMRLGVKMLGFAGRSRYAFLDYAQVRHVEETPAVANDSPLVVLRIRAVDNLHTPPS